MDDRFATAAELADSLDRLTMSEPEVRAFNELLDAVVLKVSDPREIGLVRSGSILQNYIDHARQAMGDLAAKYGLLCSWGQGQDDLKAIPPYRRLRLALAPVGTIPDTFVGLKFYLYSEEDVRVVANSDVVWRGSDPTTSEFVKAIARPVIELYLAATD